MCSRSRRSCGGNSWSWSWSTPMQCGGGGNVGSSGGGGGGGGRCATPDEDVGSKDYYEHGLYLHNYYRKRHGSPPTMLVDRLNKAADSYAYKLACMRTMVHTSGLDYNENLYMSFGSNVSKKEHVQKACEMWYDEIKYYNFNSPGFSSATGHFTAMVWKGSTQLGIGCAEANGCVVVVACYKPHANFQGQFGANVLPYRDVEDTEDEEEEEEEEEEEKEEAAKPSKKVDKEEPPSQAKEAFESNANGDKTVGWEELQVLLNDMVKVQFKFDGFDKQLCSLLISLVTARTGEKDRVTFEEFGAIIKITAGVLDAYGEFDKDMSGTLDPFELKEALNEAGFNITYKTYLTLQNLFSEKDKPIIMRFKGYFLCFLLLSKLQIVQEKKSKGSAFEDFSMKDWMQEQLEAVE